MKKILIIDEMHPSIVPLLTRAGFEVVYKPNISKEEVKNEIGQYDGMILRSKIFIGKEILEHAPGLKFIARAGAGLDQIALEEVYKRNIRILNAPEGNRDAVAEHAIGLMLALFNKLNSADIEIRNGKWLREENRGYELGGKTIGIIGYGHNGKALAKKLKGFDVNVLAHDILPKHEVENEDARMVEMEQIWEQADILSLHVPLTNLTKNLVNDAFLSRFKKNIWLFNTSRGEVVDLKALIENLDKGKVRGAGLDVLPIENLSAFKQQMPIEYEKLMQNKNVILTPHVAGWTHESYQKINEVLVKKILELGL